MKIACTLLAGLMLLFAAVQYNDPDGAVWAAIYAVPATAMGVGAARPELLATSAGRLCLGLAMTALALGTAVAWPGGSAFAAPGPWWEQEAAREGLGLGIAFLVTAVALPFARRRPDAGASGASVAAAR